jgi:hypothetical protein
VSGKLTEWPQIARKVWLMDSSRVQYVIYRRARRLRQH